MEYEDYLGTRRHNQMKVRKFFTDVEQLGRSSAREKSNKNKNKKRIILSTKYN